MGFFLIVTKMKVTLFFVLIACSLVFAQLEQKIVIDDFTVGGNIQKAIVTLGSDLFASQPNVVDTESFNEPGCTGLIGCGRDMEMRAITGFSGRSFESEIFLVTGGVFPGEWAVANPKTSESLATIQYDGQDGTFALSVNGLGNLDLTDGGTATDFRLSVIADLPTTYNIEIYSPDSSTCSFTLNVPATPGSYDYDDTIFEISPSAFSGSCDLSNVGAIEIDIPSFDAVDAIVRTIDIIGPPDPSPTPTPTPTRTPTPGPSSSNTPTPTPTRTPSRTPSPSGPCIVFCECPSFTCQLAYDLDDDDDFAFTTVFVYVDDDANPDDDQIIYIYVDDDDDVSTADDDDFFYFFDDDFFYGFDDDDDFFFGFDD